MNFKMEMELCQSRINNLAKSIPNRSTNGDKDKIREIKRKTEEKINDLETQLIDLKGSAKKDIESRISDLKNALNELDTLLNSTSDFQIDVDPMPHTIFDGNNTVIVKYDGTEGSLLNELKHAFQYETGSIDFIELKNNNKSEFGAGLLYDINDEVETYKRQYAYDGYLKIIIELSEEEINNALESGKIKKLEEITDLGVIEIKKMKKIKANIIIKISDSIALSGLYKTISKKSLDINSSIKDVLKGNNKRKNTLTSFGIDKFDKNKPYIEFIKVFINKQYSIHVK